MSEEDFRKIAKEYAEMYFTKGIDSTKIFNYVDELEKKVEQLENIRKEAITYILANCEIIRNEKENVDEVGRVNGADLLNILNKEGEDNV